MENVGINILIMDKYRSETAAVQAIKRIFLLPFRQSVCRNGHSIYSLEA